MEGVHTFFHSDFLTSAWANPPHLCTSSSHPTAAVQALHSQCGRWTPCTENRKRVDLICAHSLQVYQTPAVSHMEQINFLENPNEPLDLPRAMAAGAGLRAQVWVRFLQTENLYKLLLNQVWFLILKSEVGHKFCCVESSTSCLFGEVTFSFACGPFAEQRCTVALKDNISSSHMFSKKNGQSQLTAAGHSVRQWPTV